MPTYTHAGRYQSAVSLQELATLQSLLELARDMLANPHRFSQDDRFMLVETMDIHTEGRNRPAEQRELGASVRCSTAQLAFSEDEAELPEISASARAA
jgi:hypothetical protein